MGDSIMRKVSQGEEKHTMLISIYVVPYTRDGDGVDRDTNKLQELTPIEEEEFEVITEDLNKLAQECAEYNRRQEAYIMLGNNMSGTINNKMLKSAKKPPPVG